MQAELIGLTWGWVWVQGGAGPGWRERFCRQKVPGHCPGGCRWSRAMGGGVQGGRDEAGGEGPPSQVMKPEPCPEGGGSHRGRRMVEGMQDPC